MTNEITKNLMCIVLRGGVEVWAEEDKIKNLQKILTASKESRFVELDGETINTADISGIFTAKTMEDITRRKNGQWKDKNNVWYNRNDTPCPKCGNIVPKGKQCGYC